MDLHERCDWQSIAYLEAGISGWPAPANYVRPDISRRNCIGFGRQIVHYRCRLAGLHGMAPQQGRRPTNFVRGKRGWRYFFGGWKKSLLFTFQWPIECIRIVDEGSGQRKNRTNSVVNFSAKLFGFTRWETGGLRFKRREREFQCVD